MKLKGSIAVFAVAAAFAGTSAQAVEIDDCQALIGYAAFRTSYTGPQTGTGTGAWLAVAGNTASFTGNRTVSCTVPKNKKEMFELGRMQNDQCGAYSALASASGKLATNKPFEAASALSTLQSKLQTMSDYGKLQPAGFAAITEAVGLAQTCVNTLIAQ